MESPNKVGNPATHPRLGVRPRFSPDEAHPVRTVRQHLKRQDGRKEEKVRKQVTESSKENRKIFLEESLASSINLPE